MQNMKNAKQQLNKPADKSSAAAPRILGGVTRPAQRSRFTFIDGYTVTTIMNLLD